MYIDNFSEATSGTVTLCSPDQNIVNVVKNIIITNDNDTAATFQVLLDDVPLISYTVDEHDSFEYSGLITVRHGQSLYVTSMDGNAISVYATIVVMQDKAVSECTMFS